MFVDTPARGPSAREMSAQYTSDPVIRNCKGLSSVLDHISCGRALLILCLLLPAAGNTSAQSTQQPRVVLALSGGGSRGFAQVGALRALVDAGIPVSGVAGTSIGAIVGGLYASGYTPAEIDSIVTAVDWNDLLAVGDETRRTELYLNQRREKERSLLVLRLNGLTPQLPEAVSNGSRIAMLLDRLVWDAPCHADGDFDGLCIPYRAVVTDIASGKSVVLSRGSLSLAMRASATVPLRFSPVRVDSQLFVDGGLLQNIPVSAARTLGGEIVVTINTTSPLNQREDLDQPLVVADQVMAVMMQRQEQEALAGSDVVITPKLDGVSPTNFTSIRRSIEAGYAAGREAVPVIRALLQKQPLTMGSRPRFRAGVGSSETRETGLPAGGEAISKPPVHVASVSVTGTEDSAIIRVFDQIEGGEYNREVLDKVRRQFGRITRQQGLSFARIVAVAYDSTTQQLDVRVDPGHIVAIEIEGLHTCNPTLVKRDLSMKVGDLFYGERAEGALNRLQRSGYFSSASIDPVPVDSGGVRVVVNIQERSTGVLRLAATADNERYSQGGVEIADENILGDGIAGGLRFAGGLRNRLVAGELDVPRIASSYLTVGGVIYGTQRGVYVYDRQTFHSEGKIVRTTVGEYEEGRVGAKLRLGGQIGRVGQLVAEARLERQGTTTIRDISPDPVWRTLATLRGSLIVDSRDVVPYPRRGVLLDASYETAQTLLGSTTSFVKLDVGAQYVASFGPHAIIPSVRFGLSDATLPVLEMFSLGGQGSLPGLREDEMRGRQMALATLEYRYHLPFNIFFNTYASLRYGLGSTWLQPSEIRISELQHGLAFSVGLDTPIGPADFTLGQAFSVNRRGGGPGRPLVNFGPVVAAFSIGYRLN